MKTLSLIVLSMLIPAFASANAPELKSYFNDLRNDYKLFKDCNLYDIYSNQDLSAGDEAQKCYEFKITKITFKVAEILGGELELINIHDDTSFDMKFTLAKALRSKDYMGGRYTSPDGEYGSSTDFKNAYKVGDLYLFQYESTGGEWDNMHITTKYFLLNKAGELLGRYSVSASID
ncbi:hypothetical protein [Halobacteriovorax sp. RT-2-6]|uniref:hypothetical protein n=1 Tax=unclassified Halobacteriovorax TaxID=2639665 RepID=UPI00399B17CD